jgi:CRP/FNR family cyclic AMP-dependent transcriptional regulator
MMTQKLSFVLESSINTSISDVSTFFPALSPISPDDLQFISGRGVTKFFQKHSLLISEGDHSDTLFFIHQGKVKIFVSEQEGKEAILNIQGPGEYFGELALIDSSPRSASAITLESSLLSLVPRANFEQCLVERPTLALKLIRSLSCRVRTLTEEVKTLALYDVYGRLTRTLLKLANGNQDGLVIDQKLTHQDLANMVGASREMVSRIMKDLASGGYITIANRRITINTKLPSAW